jgi:hypothetical protein
LTGVGRMKMFKEMIPEKSPNLEAPKFMKLKKHQVEAT